MQAMNAIDAVGPALKRWRELVWDNFRVGRLLKLGFVALLAEVSGGASFNANFPSGGGRNSGGVTQLNHFWMGPWVIAVAVIAAVLMVISIVIFYLSCRMKFAEFYIAATGDTRVGPPWSRYGRQTWQLFWVTVGIWLVAFAGLLVLLSPVFIMFMRHGSNFGQHMSPGRIFALILVGIPVLLFWVMVFAFALLVVRDLMLPALALEGATVGQAWRWARAVIESSPKQFFFYVLVKVGMRITVAVAGGIALFLGLLVTAIPVAIAGVAGWQSWKHAGMGGHAAIIALGVVGGLLLVGWVLLLYVVCIGVALLVLQCYAVYWVGSRYKPLGDLLEPPPAAPVMAAPVAPLPPSGLPPEDWTPVLG